MRLAVCLAVLMLTACESKSEPAPTASASATGDTMINELAAGSPAPQVEMTLQNGDKVKLASLAGSKVLLWFYPKDDTPG